MFQHDISASDIRRRLLGAFSSENVMHSLLDEVSYSLSFVYEQMITSQTLMVGKPSPTRIDICNASEPTLVCKGTKYQFHYQYTIVTILSYECIYFQKGLSIPKNLERMDADENRKFYRHSCAIFNIISTNKMNTFKFIFNFLLK